MNLRCLLVVTPVCIGCLLSGCTTGQDKKADPKPSTVARGKAAPETKSGENPPKEKTPAEKAPPTIVPVEVEAPKPPKEIAKATSEAWTKRPFKMGFAGTDRSGAVVFTSSLGDLRGAVPAFDAESATGDADLKDLPPADVPFGLRLSNSKVTDAALKALADHKNLTALELVFTKVTNAGLKDLAKLPNLTALNLRSTDVTDAGLKELAGLKDLVSLRLASTKVTDAGVQELRKSLPKCVIVK